jgi:hypothetical protein
MRSCVSFTMNGRGRVKNIYSGLKMRSPSQVEGNEVIQCGNTNNNERETSGC